MSENHPKSEAEPTLTAADATDDAVTWLHPDDVSYVRSLLSRDEAFGTGPEFLDLVRRLVAAAEYRATVTEFDYDVREYFRRMMSFALLEDRRHDQRRADQAKRDLREISLDDPIPY